MQIEVDQSGKIEDSGDTVIAFSNKEQFTVMIPHNLKVALLKKMGKRQARYKILARGIYHCIKDYLDKDKQIIIDEEYRKHGRDIKNYLLNELRKDKPFFDKKLIISKQIGKKSRAHKLAYQTFCGKLKPNKILTEKEFE
jgi:hypothetical protein